MRFVITPKDPTTAHVNQDMKGTDIIAQVISFFILLHEKFLQFDWLRTVVFQLNLKYLHVKITNLLWVVVRITISKYHSWYLFQISLQIMLLPILTWPFCMPSNALLFLFFRDKMLLIVILDSRPYYLKILNGKFLTLGMPRIFYVWSPWLASETLLFVFFSGISSFSSVLASLFRKMRGVHFAN